MISNRLPGSFSLWAGPVSWGCRTEVPIVLLALGWGSFSVTRGSSEIPSMHSPHLQSQRRCLGSFLSLES